MLATIITFLIAGLWHGASWMFVIFGGLNGVGIAINHYWKKSWKKKLKVKIPKVLAWFITFNYVNLTLIFFRAKEWNDAIKVLEGMIGYNGFVLPVSLSNGLGFLKSAGIQFDYLLILHPRNIVAIIFGFFITYFVKNTNEKSKSFVVSIKSALFCGVLLFISIIYFNRPSDFLYFDF